VQLGCTACHTTEKDTINAGFRVVASLNASPTPDRVRVFGDQPSVHDVPNTS